VFLGFLKGAFFLKKFLRAKNAFSGIAVGGKKTRALETKCGFSC
jgi:hypothetical protein